MNVGSSVGMKCHASFFRDSKAAGSLGTVLDELVEGKGGGEGVDELVALGVVDRLVMPSNINCNYEAAKVFC